MCGIVGYVGNRPASEVIVSGLRRLEYRGYDSAGIAVVSNRRLHIRKKAGKLANLEAVLEIDPVSLSDTGIGHTRWATHGGPTDINAHPHISSNGRVAVIHNGIIENHANLAAELGVSLTSETDTEVVAHLLESIMEHTPDLADAMRATARRLEGAFTLVAVSADEPQRLVAARRNSPLVVGVGEGENFVASDVSAFIAYTREAIELGQDRVVDLRPHSLSITDYDGRQVRAARFTVTWDTAAAEKGGHDLFMLKEIAEQPKAVRDTMLGRISTNGLINLNELHLPVEDLREVDKVIIVACGTAYHAGMVAKYAIEHWTRIPCEVELASEFRYRDPIVNQRMLVIAISQSGETMDTLMAVRHAREQGAKVMAICNTVGSSIPREAHAVLYTQAGPEIAVASTKAFLTQIVAAYLVGLYLAQVRGDLFGDEVAAAVSQLAEMPAKVDLVLDTMGGVRDLARQFADSRAVLFIGRHVGYPVALEGALKLKELAYMHAEGFAAGELKHGPIALIEPGIPVIAIAPPERNVLHEKVMSNIQEVRARGAFTIVVAEEGDEVAAKHADYVIWVPAAPTLLQPLVTTVPLQVFACALATAKGHDVDQPRNLAKSVTVE